MPETNNASSSNFARFAVGGVRGSHRRVLLEQVSKVLPAHPGYLQRPITPRLLMRFVRQRCTW